ncbi:MAG: hypothetical protein RL621_1628 [Bacteroidota bacterium]|jgi:protoporphyrinogen oxidase
MKKVKYLIVGAGVSGISAANFLGKDQDYLIIEKENSIGGYCRTIYQDGFIWDYSGHFFHFKDEEIKKLVLKNINPADLISIKKSTCILYKGEYISFPFQKYISELPKDEFIDCLYDFYFRNSIENSGHNFLGWLYSSLGKSITDKFVKPYNEKLYACSLDKLDINAMGRFFPVVTLNDLISSFKQKQDDSYNNTFVYPRKGAITYINSLAKDINQDRIFLNESVLGIDLAKKIAFTINHIINYDYLISTIPLDSLLRITSKPFDQNIYSSNKVIVFNMGFDKPFDKHDYHWIYIPDNDIVFYRVGFYSNILGESRGSIYVEIGMNQNDKVDFESLKVQVLQDLQKLKIIEDHKLISHSAVVMNPAYLHLSKDSIVDSQLKISDLRDNSVYCVGRYAEWTYCAIEDNILSAREAVKDILQLER